MPLQFKEGVSLRGLCAEIIPPWSVVIEVFNAHGSDCIITSANDSHHTRGSRHYIGHALDFRSKHIPSLEEKKQIEKEIQERLAPLGDFDFFLEAAGTANEHYHLQFKPKETL